MDVPLAAQVTTFYKWVAGQVSVRRREMKVGKREKAVADREQRIERIRHLIDIQEKEPERFLHSRLSKLFVSSETEVGIQIEWLNSTVFVMEVKSVRGSVRMNGAELGHQMVLNSPQVCRPGECCTCILYIHVNPRYTAEIQEARVQNKSVILDMNINWDIAYDEREKPLSLQGQRGEIRIVPS